MFVSNSGSCASCSCCCLQQGSVPGLVSAFRRLCHGLTASSTRHPAALSGFPSRTSVEVDNSVEDNLSVEEATENIVKQDEAIQNVLSSKHYLKKQRESHHKFP
ncbi:hypothetical protein ATANTOWER_009366, partial [Ataeniobius toweri]|nr:hypothetical protein [Ataeniobius toweri]